jgi:chromosome segregation protein
MRLSKIKLAGFKSFVDPTPIYFPGDLVGIVGPNGCGKSNVIDAIRWVMGESSAKHLRGDSMADVIFNGSSARKPVGTASVELFFDNSDGSIGGQFAKYSEICIKRAVSRDGLSQYFLNNTRCRRKDITGIFLGTGLGPRSYAIIEQGMISRLIEAKPDEMRVYIEEAAGISKYKERRRETENRIRHTRDNLDRLNDLREEIENQIKHLQRQAKQAERYKVLKQDERTLEAELFAIRFSGLQNELTEHQNQLSQGQTRLEAEIAEQRNIEARIERAREIYTQVTDEFNAAQGRFYAVQAEISKLEQSIAHSKETRERQHEDLQQAKEQLVDANRDLDKDTAQIQDLDSSLEQLAPDLAQARSAEIASGDNLKRVESALEEWQRTWHEFMLETKEHQQVSQVEGARIEQLEVRLTRFKDEHAQLADERQGISIAEIEESVVAQNRIEQEKQQAVDTLNQSIQALDREIVGLREQEQNLGSTLERIHGELESRRGRFETLETLQEAALGQDQEEVKRWIAQENLGDRPHLAQKLQVEKPWELAVETVLGDFLQAICVTRSEEHIANLPDAALALIDAEIGSHGGSKSPAALQSLLSKVNNAGSASALLAAVRFADSLNEALAIRERARPGETVITSDGVWLGKGWIRVNRGQHESGGLISREQDIRDLRDRVRDYEQQIKQLEDDRQKTRGRLQQLETERNAAQTEIADANRRFAEANTILAGLKRDFDQANDRLATLNTSGQAIRDEVASVEEAIRDSRASLLHATEALGRIDERRPALQSQRERLVVELDDARATAAQDRENAARINIEFESRRASRESASTSLSRITTQREQLHSRVETLSRQMTESEAPISELQHSLDTQLQREIVVERELGDQRRKVEGAETRLREEEGRRADCETKVAEAREVVDAIRMQVRETEVRREGITEQLSRLDMELDSVLSELPEEANGPEWEERLAKIRRSIDRLGAINLAAIDEFTEQSERKVYLDAQFEDLTSALATLEGAIRKIDRETRTRFQETFDSVNKGLQKLFPKLFGGGHAYLLMDGDDLLNSGVTVMARPPGKRNSSIHLLSGGEKALTAVALVFSIFELNPAPFCLLDEVDAPLDDTNVGRFCEIVKEMSKSVQFLIITHNKTTMEMASQLTGVTMNEPGVSRLVSVDIEEAVQLVAS